VKDETPDYYRMRARAECEAALNASCPEARHAHAELARAYQHLAEIGELEQRGELPPGKVTTLTDALRDRDDAERGGHAPKPPRTTGDSAGAV
jgi:hypothetical protein